MKHRFQLCVPLFVVLVSVSDAQYHYNQAGSFNGTSSYIAVPNHSELNPTSAMTVEAWIWPTRLPSGSGGYGIVGKNFFSSYSLGFTPSGRLYFIPKTGTQLSQRPASRIDTTQWTHVAATYDGTTTAIYLNGVLDTSTTSITGPISTNSDSLRIGAETGPAYFFPGLIDEVRLWSVARSAAEILRDRSIPLAMISGTPMPPGPYFGLVGAWRLNGDALDEAGTGPNHGAPHNVTYADLRQKQVNYVDYNNTVVLNGFDAYCATGANPAFDATAAITLEAWVKRDTSAPQNLWQNIVNRSGGTDRYNYALYTSRTGGLWFEFNWPGGYTLFRADVLTTPEWTHVAATYSSATGRATLYVNGDSLASIVVSGTPPIQTNPDSFFVGGIGCSSFASNKFKGQIDQVRIWKNQARSADEIRAGMFTSVDFATAPPPTGVTVYGFDGRNTHDLSPAGSYPALFFVGSARLSSAHRQINTELTSPLLRDDAGGFGGPTYVVSRRHMAVPDNNTAGVIDSVYVSAAGSATGVKLFLLMNHTWVSDLSVTLTGPTGVSAVVFPRQNGSNNDIMTVFDDAAESVAGATSALGFAAPFSPLLKPSNPLAVFSGAPRQGWWKLKIVDNASADLGTVLGWGVQTSPLTGVEESGGRPEEFALMQNYPNPFNPTTMLRYTLPGPSNVTLKIYNLLGQEVRTLVNDVQGAGNYSIEWNSTNNSGDAVGSGVYFYTLQARAEGLGRTGEFSQTRKMLLVK